MKKLTEAETIMCAAAILSTGAEPKDVFIEPQKLNPDDCPKCGFGLSDEWPDGRRVCDDCDHEWFKAPDSSANNDKQNTPASGLNETACSAEWFPARYANRMHIGDPHFKVLSWSRLGTLCGREMNPGRSLRNAPKCKTCAKIFKQNATDRTLTN